MLKRDRALTVFGALVAVSVVGACSAMPLVVEDAVVPVTEAPFTSPLDEFIGQAVWTNQEEFQRASDEFAVLREELIAQCMREAGFNYQPDINSDRWTIASGHLDDIHPDDREWVSQYGLGIVSGHRMRTGGTIFDVRDDDPNAEYVAGLSDLAREAFEAALYGPADNPPTQMAVQTQADWEDWMRTRGCWGQAIVEAQANSPLFLREQDEFAPLFSAISDMQNNVSERPDMVTLNSEWSHCMADAGHVGLSSPADGPGRFWSEYMNTSFTVQQLQAEGMDVDRAEMLAPLQAREIDLALADLDCRISIDYRARLNAIMLEAESQFVVDHRALLEDFRNAAE